MNHVVDKNISVAVRRKKFYRGGGGPTIEPTGGDVAEPTRNHFSRCVALATISPLLLQDTMQEPRDLFRFRRFPFPVTSQGAIWKTDVQSSHFSFAVCFFATF